MKLVKYKTSLIQTSYNKYYVIMEWGFPKSYDLIANDGKMVSVDIVGFQIVNDDIDL